jgi:hypothetical protein
MADAELLDVIAGLGDDERRVLLAVAKRLAMGRNAYGLLDIDGDPRDWRAPRPPMSSSTDASTWRARRFVKRTAGGEAGEGRGAERSASAQRRPRATALRARSVCSWDRHQRSIDPMASHRASGGDQTRIRERLVIWRPGCEGPAQASGKEIAILEEHARPGTGRVTFAASPLVGHCCHDPLVDCECARLLGFVVVPCGRRCGIEPEGMMAVAREGRNERSASRLCHDLPGPGRVRGRARRRWTSIGERRATVARVTGRRAIRCRVNGTSIAGRQRTGRRRTAAARDNGKSKGRPQNAGRGEADDVLGHDDKSPREGKCVSARYRASAQKATADAGEYDGPCLNVFAARVRSGPGARREQAPAGVAGSSR